MTHFVRTESNTTRLYRLMNFAPLGMGPSDEAQYRALAAVGAIMKPTLNILHWPANRYTSSHETDIRETFRRIRAERKSASELVKQETAANQASVQRIFQLRREGK